VSNSNPTSSTDTEPAVDLIGVAAPTVATELRRRRELLGWSQAEAARRSGVSRTVINEIEAGKRMPHTGTYERLRGAMGLVTPAAAALLRRAQPREITEEQLQVLAACLIAGQGGTLSVLADATGVSIPAVREGILALADRLAACGVAAVDDGAEVRLTPHPWAADAVAVVSGLEVQAALTDEAVQVLVCIGVLGAPTRREIDNLRGGDCESVVERLVRRGLLQKTRDDALAGDPNVYGLTALALGAVGHATLESFQTWCAEQAVASGS
jgi:chromosome segregation and condensation protein ScpB